MTEGLKGSFASKLHIKVSGKEYTLSELTMADISAAEDWIRNERLRTFLEQTRMVNLPNEVRASTMASILSTGVAFDEVLQTVSGQCYLLYRSVGHTEKGMSFENFISGIEDANLKMLSEAVVQISGLSEEVKEAEQEAAKNDPLASSTSTTP